MNSKYNPSNICKILLTISIINLVFFVIFPIACSSKQTEFKPNYKSAKYTEIQYVRLYRQNNIIVDQKPITEKFPGVCTCHEDDFIPITYVQCNEKILLNIEESICKQYRYILEE